MSKPTVSFRISDYHLARGLRAIRLLEPDWQLTTPASIIRTIFNDFIAKSERQNNSIHEVSPTLLQEIALARSGSSKQVNELNSLPQLGQTNQSNQLNQSYKSPEQIKRELEEDKIFQEMRRESIAKFKNQQEQSQQDKYLDEQIKLASQAEARTRTKASEFHDPNITESSISTVTDFSPPKDWIS